MRAYVDRQRAALRRMLNSPRRAGVELARRHAGVMDELLRALYTATGLQRHERSLLLAAVGGYGRRLLGWRSDLDVCFVTSGSPELLAPVIEQMLYPLWDAGLSVGHHVVTVGEAAAAALQDLPTATELLDLRPIAGNRALGRSLHDQLFSTLLADGQVASFVSRLEERSAARHTRFGDSVYLLEPDVKNGTGGLRDLDFALWAARARFRCGSLTELGQLGIVPMARVEEAQHALDFLWTIRNHLHELAGRRSDRLTFAEQEAVASQMGYGARTALDESRPLLERTGAMVEAFMSDYYRHARVITAVSELVFGHARRRSGGSAPPEEPLGDGLVLCEGGVGLCNPAELSAEPALALRLYATAVARDKPVLARSRDAISDACAEPAFCARLRESTQASALFVQLASSRRKPLFRSGSILAELHDVGLLLAMIPEFAPVVGRVHHDIYHVYTVDVHSVAAVDRLHALARGELVNEHALASRLAAEVTRPKMLALATLLHDVGKAIGGHNHAQRGADMARPILLRLGLAPEDVEDACHLILKHLALYLVAARRDLSDTATIADFAGEVRGREGLRDLYLLTVADLSTTSPSAMTKWKASMVDELWRRTDALLSGYMPQEPSRVQRVRAEARALWQGEPQLLSEYLDTMPERYLLSNTATEIAAHAALVMQKRDTPVCAALVDCTVEDVMELCVVIEGRASTGLCVVAGDRPGLLAAISAAISANRLRIQAAQIHSRKLPSGGAQAVDLFWVTSPDGDVTMDERLAKLQRDLSSLIKGERVPADLMRPSRSSRSTLRPLPPVPTEVLLEHHASAEHTIIEVITEDKPGLLYYLAQAMSSLGLTIGVAKISTEGTRVTDVFYVTEACGGKVEPGERADHVRETLLAMLRGLHAQSSC